MNYPLTVWKLALFIIVTAILLFISRSSLRKLGSHGFFRFFAWECILILFLRNMDFWFIDPLSWRQLIAWLFLSASIVPLVFGIQSLVTRGKPTKARASDPSLLGFEKTSTLVTTGIYAYIRHPLYCSLLLLAWGIYFKGPTLSLTGWALAATLFLYLTAKADETECIQFFGQRYQEYIKQTKMFIPYIF